MELNFFDDVENDTGSTDVVSQCKFCYCSNVVSCYCSTLCLETHQLRSGLARCDMIRQKSLTWTQQPSVISLL